jgi:hypothetical protein
MHEFGNYRTGEKCPMKKYWLKNTGQTYAAG